MRRPSSTNGSDWMPGKRPPAGVLFVREPTSFPENVAMNTHYIQHVPFEGLGCIAEYFKSHGHALSATHIYRGESLPELETIDWLVIMGGPMGVHDEISHPWLRDEKRYVESAIVAGKRVLGICLGAQIIADVMGAQVSRSEHREIGWFPIVRSGALDDTILAPVIPAEINAFHWHSDTFEIPSGAYPVASSEACKNQGFIADDRVVAFQFHLEASPELAEHLVEKLADDLDGSPYVQDATKILADASHYQQINDVMFATLDAMAGSADVAR